VLSQTCNDLEIIVSDDSPDDRLRNLAMSFSDPRLRYRHNQPALGVACNHWACFRESRGEFISILNHDDWIAPHFVDRLTDRLRRSPQAVLAFCDHWLIDDHGQRLHEASDQTSAIWGRDRLAAGLHQPFYDLLAAQTIPMAMGTVFRRSALPDDLPEDAGPAYDLWLTYLLARCGAGAWFEPERLSAWRVHEGSLTSEGGLAWRLGAASCWHRISQDKAMGSIAMFARRKAAEGFYGCSLRCWIEGLREDGVRNAVRSLSIQPTVKGAMACLLPLLPRRLAPARWSRGVRGP